jgi:hypothetical protein
VEQPGCAFNFKTSQCREGNVKSASPEELFRADDDVDQSKDDSLAIFRLAEPTPGCNGDDWKALERILAVDGCLKGSLVVVVSVIGEVPDLMVLHEAPNLLIREVIGQTEISQSLTASSSSSLIRNEALV